MTGRKQNGSALFAAPAVPDGASDAATAPVAAPAPEVVAEPAPAPPAPVQAPSAAPQVALQARQGALAAIIADPDRLREFPVETVERLFAMDKEMRADASRDAYYEAFSRVQARMTPIGRRGRIDFGRGKPAPYALAEDVAGMLHPLLMDEGFSYSLSEGECDKGMTRFVLTLRHVGGHSERHHMDVPVGSGKGGTMNSIQAMASTYTYCQRHLLLKVFGVIITDDNDGADVKGQEPLTDSQLADLEALIADVNPGPGFAAFLRNVFRADSPADVAQADYPKVIRALEQKRRAQ